MKTKTKEKCSRCGGVLHTLLECGVTRPKRKEVIATQPNEKRCGAMREEHEFALPPCCPITKNPQPGSYIRIRYRPKNLLLEVQSLHDYIKEYVGGRLDVRSMEGMIQNIAKDCANTLGVKVKVKCNLVIIPLQKMKLECTGYPEKT